MYIYNLYCSLHVILKSTESVWEARNVNGIHSEHVVYTLVFHRETHCALKQCDSGRCCCSVQMILVLGETHTATVWRGNERVESKKIDVSASSKWTSFTWKSTSLQLPEIDGSEPRITGNRCSTDGGHLRYFPLTVSYLCFLYSKAPNPKYHISERNQREFSGDVESNWCGHFQGKLDCSFDVP